MAPMRKDVSQLTGPELDRLVRGFQALTALPPSDQDSFATIATYHGLPAWHCQHGNVLFPLWHRAYILRLERALRKVLNDSTFAMPFWNETSSSSAKGGLPPIFTNKTYSWSDGSGSVANPLYSYKLQAAISDTDGKIYTKPVGYQTVRYPWSGLVSGQFEVKTQEHNAAVASMPPAQVTDMLNQNVVTWLTNETYTNSDGEKIPAGEIDKFNACLKAPNFTVFSNITSANAWNKKHPSPNTRVVVAVEEPHNAVHLAVGGFSIPGQGNRSAYDFANGDMGDNETAAYDPVFYFHHCFIDYMFWKWQVLNQQTTDLPIDSSLPGVGRRSLTTDLDPFSAKEVNNQDRPLQGKDIVDITTLGYSYPEVEHRLHREAPVDAPKLAVTGINRKDISGSFLVTTWAKGEGNDPHRLLKVQPVLSRWNVDACENCQEHLDVESHIHLLDFTHEEAEKATFFALVHTYENMKGDNIVDRDSIKIDVKTGGTQSSS